MTFTLPALPFAPDALAPHMSAETFEFHHGKHHKAYIDNGNKLLEGSGLEKKSLEEIVMATVKDSAKVGLFNNAAQHWNHSFFWNCLKKGGGGKSLPGNLAKAIDRGATGPVARASGVTRDLRKDEPYLAYPELQGAFKVVASKGGDCHSSSGSTGWREATRPFRRPPDRRCARPPSVRCERSFRAWQSWAR